MTWFPLPLPSSRGRDRHAGRSPFPHQVDVFWRETVGLVEEVAQGALQLQGFLGQTAGWFDGPGEFGAQAGRRVA